MFGSVVADPSIGMLWHNEQPKSSQCRWRSSNQMGFTALSSSNNPNTVASSRQNESLKKLYSIGLAELVAWACIFGTQLLCPHSTHFGLTK